MFTALRLTRLECNSNHVANTKSTQLFLTKSYLTSSDSLGAPIKVSNNRRKSHFYIILCPVILHSPQFATTVRKRHHQLNLDAASVLFRFECKRFDLNNVITGPFGFKFRNFILDANLSFSLFPFHASNHR